MWCIRAIKKSYSKWVQISVCCRSGSGRAALRGSAGVWPTVSRRRSVRGRRPHLHRLQHRARSGNKAECCSCRLLPQRRILPARLQDAGHLQQRLPARPARYRHLTGLMCLINYTKHRFRSSWVKPPVHNRLIISYMNSILTLVLY